MDLWTKVEVIEEVRNDWILGVLKAELVGFADQSNIAINRDEYPGWLQSSWRVDLPFTERRLQEQWVSPFCAAVAEYLRPGTW